MWDRVPWIYLLKNSLKKIYNNVYMGYDVGYMINSGYGATFPLTVDTDIVGPGSTISAYMTGGAKKAKKANKVKKGKKVKKTPMRHKKTPMRHKISSKAKSMSKMRMRNTKKLNNREHKLSNRLKHRKARANVIDLLASNSPLSKDVVSSLSPSMKKFVSKIPKNKSSSSLYSSSLSSWPSVTINQSSHLSAKTPNKKQFLSSRKGLADILKKQPNYVVKSKSLIKFSDYKSTLSKDEAKDRSKSKKKGRSR
jgi:hypothetical protein